VPGEARGGNEGHGGGRFYISPWGTLSLSEVKGREGQIKRGGGGCGQPLQTSGTGVSAQYALKSKVRVAAAKGGVVS